MTSEHGLWRGEGKTREGTGPTWQLFAEAAFAHLDPAATVQIGVEHELEDVRDVALEDVELGPEDGPAAKHFGDAVLVTRVDEVDLEEGRVADVVAVEVGALAQHDEGDELRGPVLVTLARALAVPVRQRQLHCAVERCTEPADVVVDCARTIERVGARSRAECRMKGGGVS